MNSIGFTFKVLSPYYLACDRISTFSVKHQLISMHLNHECWYLIYLFIPFSALLEHLTVEETEEESCHFHHFGISQLERVAVLEEFGELTKR